MKLLKKSSLYPILLKIYQKLHKACIWTFWQICSLFPVKKQKVIFSNFNGNGFGDNPRYIAEEFIRRKLSYELYWVCDKKGCKFPKELHIIRPNSLSFVYHMSTAGFWVDNTRKLYYLKKKKSQTYVHTWHAGPGLKKTEADAENALSKEYVAFAKKDSTYIDLLISNCKFCTNYYQRYFWYDGEIRETGIPKNDLYFQDIQKVRELVRKYYHLPIDCKLALYVPTWRENRKLHVYHLDFEACLKALETRFGGTWFMLVRMHPNVNAADFDIRYNERILNASPYDNVQELLAAGDICITDYSSCGIDYIQLNRPSFLYAEDYEDMKHTKDYALKLDELPMPKAFNNEEMIQNILNFSEENYQKERVPFMEKIGFCDDGHASERIVDYIVEKGQYETAKFSKLSV